MIDLHVEGYCQECAGFQPCIERLYADGKIIAQTVYCENRERCANIYEFIVRSTILCGTIYLNELKMHLVLNSSFGRRLILWD